MSKSFKSTKTKIRLIDDPKVTARWQIQELVDTTNDLWDTLRMFSNEHEARTHFAEIKENGLGIRVVETAEIEAA